MRDPVTELAERSLSLSPKERVRLMDVLLESLQTPVASETDLEWEREIERRVQLFESGGAELHDAADVLAEAARVAP